MNIHRLNTSQQEYILETVLEITEYSFHTVLGWLWHKGYSKLIYLHKLKRSLKILHRIHFNPEELHSHDETNDALDYVRALFLLP